MAAERAVPLLRWNMEKPSSDRTSPDGIISRPLTSGGRALTNLLDWQSVPFEILNPDHSTHPSSMLAAPLGFRRSDQDLMFQSHPSLFAPIQFPLPDLDPGDTTPFDPVSPASGSEGPGDAATYIDDKQSIQAILSDTEHSYSNPNIAGALDDKTGFWDTVMCSPTQGRTASVVPDDVLDLIPPSSTVPMCFPPLPQADLLGGTSPPKPFPPFLPSPVTNTKLEGLPETNPQPAPTPAVVDAVSSDRQERPYECSQCGLRFRKRCNAINHTKIVHEKLRPYKCSHCDRAFGKKSNCQKHEKLHTSGLKFGHRSVVGRNSQARLQAQQAIRGQANGQGQFQMEAQLRGQTKGKIQSKNSQTQRQFIPDIPPPTQSAGNGPGRRKATANNSSNLLPFSTFPEPRSSDGVLSLLGDLKD